MALLPSASVCFRLFVPYELSAWLLGQFSGLPVSASSLWNSVERQGRRALVELSEQSAQQQAGALVVPEASTETTIATLPLAVSCQMA